MPTTDQRIATALERIADAAERLVAVHETSAAFAQALMRGPDSTSTSAIHMDGSAFEDYRLADQPADYTGPDQYEVLSGGAWRVASLAEAFEIQAMRTSRKRGRS